MDRQAEINTQLSKLEKEVEESYANFKDDIGEILPYEYHPIPTWIIILGAVFIIWALIFTFKRND